MKAPIPPSHDPEFDIQIQPLRGRRVPTRLERLEADLAQGTHVFLRPIASDWAAQLQKQIESLADLLSRTIPGPEWGPIDPDLEKRFGIKRSTFYTLIDLGRIRSRVLKTRPENVSGRRLVYLPSVRAFLDSLAEEESQNGVLRSLENGGDE